MIVLFGEITSIIIYSQPGAAGRGEHTPAGSCAVVHVVGGQAGTSTKLTVSYKIPGTDTELRQSTHLSVYR